jgi:hypothetical protein
VTDWQGSVEEAVTTPNCPVEQAKEATVWFFRPVGLAVSESDPAKVAQPDTCNGGDEEPNESVEPGLRRRPNIEKGEERRLRGGGKKGVEPPTVTEAPEPLTVKTPLPIERLPSTWSCPVRRIDGAVMPKEPFTKTMPDTDVAREESAWVGTDKAYRC